MHPIRLIRVKRGKQGRVVDTGGLEGLFWQKTWLSFITRGTKVEGFSGPFATIAILALSEDG
jgi:hypothetical protein